MPGDWWTGSPKSGLERALAMGGLPPPGSMPQEMENAYRMAPAEHDPWNFDAPKGPTRGELVGGWSRQAADAQQAQRSAGREARETEMAGNLRSLVTQGQGRRRRRPTMKDAGDALAEWEGRETTRLNRSSGIM